MQSIKERESQELAKSTKDWLIKRLWRSTFLWILICLVGFDCFLIGVRPLQYVQVRGLLTEDQEPLNDKLEQLYSAISKPNLLILGSSLPMHACFEADWIATDKPNWPTNYILRHTGSKYLNGALNKQLGLNVQGFDLGMPACMISDYDTILKDVLAHNIKPKVLLLAIAPRDFIDNMAQPIGKTRYSKFFSDRRDGLKLSLTKTPEENTEELLRHAWRFFKVRADYNRTIEFIVCSTLGRASTIFNAVAGKGYNRQMLNDITTGMSTAPYRDPEPNDQAAQNDLVVYRKRYFPFNKKRLVAELGYLDGILAECRRQDILSIVVNMPVHPDNMRLLSNEQRDLVDTGITDICAHNGTKFININAKDYAGNDFSDSVHLRSKASTKFFDQLAAELKSSPYFSRELAQRLPNNKQRQIAGATPKLN